MSKITGDLQSTYSFVSVWSAIQPGDEILDGKSWKPIGLPYTNGAYQPSLGDIIRRPTAIPFDRESMLLERIENQKNSIRCDENQIEDLKARLGAAASQNDAIVDQNVDLIGERNTAMSECRELRKQNVGVRRRLDETLAELERLRIEAAGLAERNVAGYRQVEEQHETIERLKNENQALARRKVECASTMKVEELWCRVRHLETEIVRRKSELDEVYKVNVNQAALIGNLRIEKEALLKQRSMVEVELARRCDDLKETARRSDLDNEALKIRLQLGRSHWVKLKLENDALKTSRDCAMLGYAKARDDARYVREKLKRVVAEELAAATKKFHVFIG